jgi:Mce-associated membrane protein
MGKTPEKPQPHTRGGRHAASEPLAEQAPSRKPSPVPRPRNEDVAGPKRPRAPRGRRVVLAVAVVIALLGAGTAAFGGVRAHALAAAADPGNHAVVDQAATRAVIQQVGQAVETVYSYDYRHLKSGYDAGAQVVTGEFASTYQKRFKQVKEQAAKNELTLTALVDTAGVQKLHGGAATLLVFVDQTATAGGGKQRVHRGSSLLVHARKVHGTWKIAQVTSV